MKSKRTNLGRAEHTKSDFMVRLSLLVRSHLAAAIKWLRNNATWLGALGSIASILALLPIIWPNSTDIGLNSTTKCPFDEEKREYEWVDPTSGQFVLASNVTLLRTTDARRAPSADPSCDRDFDYTSGTEVRVEARSGDFSWVTNVSTDDWAWILTSSFSEGNS